ncbi:hypothetical protein [Brucella anthropi]|uniref:hypothetical protein n=1 Tax=Brucella anthropi TaxID=529 RepID=UPI000A9B0290|nr:hypothetical protein [Brucella anthropi]
MTKPHKGGRYVRDPKSGALSRASDTIPPVAEQTALPEAELTETTTEAALPASTKKGK